jgi:O-antigen/teichoic acid export membrane protein
MSRRPGLDLPISTALRLGSIVGQGLIGVATARLLGPAGKGEYTLITLIPTLLQTAFLFGASQLVVSDVIRTGRGTSRMRRLLALCLTSTAVGAVALALAWPWVRPTGEAAALLCSLVFATCVFLAVGEFQAAWLQAKRRFVSLAFFRFAQVLLPGAGAIGGAEVSGLDGALVGFALGHAIFAATGLLAVPIFAGWAGGPPLVRAAQTHTAIAVLSLFLLYRLDVLVAAFVLSGSELGFYTVAVAVGEATQASALVYITIVTPRIVERRGIVAANEVRMALLVTVVPALGVVACGAWLVPFAFGSDFSRAAIPAMISAVACMPLAVFRIRAGAYLSQLTGGRVTTIALVASVVQVILVLVLGSAFNAVGVALASGLTYLVAALLAQFLLPGVQRGDSGEQGGRRAEPRSARN